MRRDRARKRLRDALAIAPDEAFLAMTWAVSALRDGRPDLARRVIEVPREAEDQRISGEYAVFPWELETLVNQLVLTPKNPGPRYYACNSFSTAGEFINLLKATEGAEYAADGDPSKIMSEMHRIGQRQFPWQRSTVNLPNFYRALFLYGQGAAADQFLAAHGITVSDFVLVGFALFALFSSQPAAGRQINLDIVDLGPQQLEAALQLLAINAPQARLRLNETIVAARAAAWPMAYKPSLLRRFPILAYGEAGSRLRAPLPPLIIQRITFGLYYDVIQPGGAARNEIAARFERYAADLLQAMIPELQVTDAYAYAAGRGRRIDTPDILVNDDGGLALVIECKATKLTIAAQFSEDPAIDASERYAEIGKAVFQVWRFFAHCRLGRTQHQLTVQTRGLVLTLDTWLVMARDLQRHVLEVARALADADPEIEAADRRPVLFAAIQDLERLLSRGGRETLFATLDSAQEERFHGYLLPDVARDLELPNEQRPYPFEPGDLLPWWGQFQDEDD